MANIYKFRDWENDYHKQVLTEQLFFCSSISNFNDPFDSTIPIDYAGLTQKEKIESVENHVSNNYPKAIGSERIKLIEKVFQESAIDDPEQLQKNHEEVVIPKIEREIGILSFAGNREHILMWSHYANSHKGFCVGINKKELQESIRPLLITEDKFLKLYDVLYQKSYPQINPLKVSPEEYFALPLTIKSKVWEYEDEVRLIFKDGANELLKVEKELFQDITLGCRISEDHQNEILEVVKTEFDELPVYKAKLSDDMFSLVFDRIQ
jgi:hypothetical protein